MQKYFVIYFRKLKKGEAFLILFYTNFFSTKFFFCILAIFMWNCLPNHLRICNDFNSFEQKGAFCESLKIQFLK